jgi:predicted transcriptional regulator
MGISPAGISDANWVSWPVEAREFILDRQEELRAQEEEIKELRAQLTALATELASLWERIGRSIGGTGWFAG